MASFLDAADRAALLHRLASLTPASQPRWGKFSVEGMLCHLREAARMASGELPVADRGKKIFQIFPIKHLILYVFPFPKGAPTAPELIAASPSEFSRTMAELHTALEGFLQAGDRPAPRHPLFGPLSRAEWGALVHKHTDHHLRQFGA